MGGYNLKQILTQLNSWCATNGISVKSVYDDCKGLTLQQLVYYLLGVVKEAVSQVVENTDNFNELYTFVHNYFDDLNVQDEIDNKLDELVENGTLLSLLTTHFKLGNCLYIGNSYTTGVGSTSGNTGLKALTEHLFYNTYSYTGSGVGFFEYYNHETTFSDLLSQAVNNMTEDEKTSITHILVLSAMGDARYISFNGFSFDNFLGGLQNFNTIAQENFPNATVYVASVGSEGIDIDASDGNTGMRSDCILHQAFTYTIPRLRNVVYLGWLGWDILYNINNFSSDNYHPNDRGYAILANGLIESLCGGGHTPIIKYDNINGSLGRFSNHIIGEQMKTSIIPQTNSEDFNYTSTPTEIFNFNALVRPLMIRNNYTLLHRIGNDINNTLFFTGVLSSEDGGKTIKINTGSEQSSGTGLIMDRIVIDHVFSPSTTIPGWK